MVEGTRRAAASRLRDNRLRGPLLAVAGLGLLGSLPLQTAWRQVLVLAAVWAVAAVALNLWQGYAGEISFGHAAFAAVGGYVATVLRADSDLALPLVVLIAVIVTAATAAVVGWAVVQLTHFGSAIVTFFLAFLVVELLRSASLREVSGGENGLLVPPLEVGSLDLSNPVALLFVTLGFLAGTVVLTANYASGRAGRALLLVRRSEVVAGTMGVNVQRVKLTAFVYTAIFAGITGILLSLAIGFVTPGLFAATASVTLVAMIVVGGSGTTVGPILGALFFSALPVVMQGAGEQQAVYAAAIFLLFLIFLPVGVAGLPRELLRNPRLAAIRAVRRTGPGPVEAELRPPAELPDVRRVEPRPLRVEALDVRFGKVAALSGVSLTVEPGSVHAVVGANGAGKSTLLNALSGIQPPSAGRCLIGDDELTGRTTRQVRALGVARTFQHPSHVPNLSALANVSLGLYAAHPWSLARDLLGLVARARYEAALVERSAAALHLVGLPSHRHDVRAGDLSLAETRLVDIARALIDDASVVLLDEPTAGLGEEEIGPLRDALVRVQEARGMSIVVVAHHLEFVREIADHLTVLGSGAVLADGAPDEVLQRPEVIEAFLGCAPVGAAE